MLKVALLISGDLGLRSLQTIMDNKHVELSCVLTDNNSTNIIIYCLEHNLKLFRGNPRNDKSLNFLKAIGAIDIFFSINYLFLLNKDLIKYPRKYCLNIHGSLLPKYRGRTPHVWAIINGEDKTGITVHQIDEGVDTGKVLLQKEVKITQENTGADILQNYFLLYPDLINASIDLILNDNVIFSKQDEKRATYYGKRIPEDGEINWNWNKERIRNWIRALANPYPGAFTYLNNNKLIIHKAKYSDLGYSFNMENGLILSVKPLIVKTPNGALELIDYSFMDNLKTQLKKLVILGK